MGRIPFLVIYQKKMANDSKMGQNVPSGGGKMDQRGGVFLDIGDGPDLVSGRSEA